MRQFKGSSRSRWAAFGAALAVTVGGGGLMSASASDPSGSESVFVPITPCRVMDTRPDGGVGVGAAVGKHVGPRSTPLLGQETYTISVLGHNGNCDIPTDAVGLVVNLTADRAVGSSYLTVWPADVARPLASSLNWATQTGGLANANVATVDVSADGKISMFSNFGSVEIIIDVNGYFTKHENAPVPAPSTVVTRSQSLDLGQQPDGQIVEVVVACGPGERATGGGYSLTPNVPIDVSTAVSSMSSRPSNPDGTEVANGGTATAWFVSGLMNTTPSNLQGHVLKAWVQCEN